MKRLIGFLTFSNMLEKGPLLCKLSASFLALKRLLTGVNPVVLLQAPCLSIFSTSAIEFSNEDPILPVCLRIQLISDLVLSLGDHRLKLIPLLLLLRSLLTSSSLTKIFTLRNRRKI